MAKRPPSPRPRSQADDLTATPDAPARPRSRRSRAGAAGNPADAAIASSDSDAIGAGDMGPTDDEIRERAYHRYLQRGGGHGMDFDDWLEAERELKNHRRG